MRVVETEGTLRPLVCHGINRSCERLPTRSAIVEGNRQNNGVMGLSMAAFFTLCLTLNGRIRRNLAAGFVIIY